MKFGQGRYGLMGHQGRISGIPPRMRPLPSQRSQSGHFTGGASLLGSAWENNNTEVRRAAGVNPDVNVKMTNSRHEIRRVEERLIVSLGLR